jgi:hypothetical protein
VRKVETYTHTHTHTHTHTIHLYIHEYIDREGGRGRTAFTKKKKRERGRERSNWSIARVGKIVGSQVVGILAEMLTIFKDGSDGGRWRRRRCDFGDELRGIKVVAGTVNNGRAVAE